MKSYKLVLVCLLLICALVGVLAICLERQNISNIVDVAGISHSFAQIKGVGYEKVFMYTQL